MSNGALATSPHASLSIGEEQIAVDVEDNTTNIRDIVERRKTIQEKKVLTLILWSFGDVE